MITRRSDMLGMNMNGSIMWGYLVRNPDSLNQTRSKEVIHSSILKNLVSLSEWIFRNARM